MDPRETLLLISKRDTASLPCDSHSFCSWTEWIWLSSEKRGTAQSAASSPSHARKVLTKDQQMFAWSFLISHHGSTHLIGLVTSSRAYTMAIVCSGFEINASFDAEGSAAAMRMGRIVCLWTPP